MSDLRAARGIRWWPAAVIAVLLVLAQVWVWAFAGEQRQDRVVLSVLTLFVGFMLLLAWAVAFSRLRWRIRLAVVTAVALPIVFAITTLRIRGVSGDLIPIVEWRWQGVTTFADAPPETVSSPAPVVAGPLDYPQFLGPSRDGRLEGRALARGWTSPAPRLLWRRPIGAGWSAFAVVGDYALTQEQRGESEVVSCYDARNGEPRWFHADPVRFDHPLGGVGPRATPTIHGGRVYTLGATGILNAFDLDTGQRLWTRDIVADNGSRVPEYGFAGSPLVLEALVVVEAGGGGGRSLVAYDRDTGEPVWSGGDDPAAYGSPVRVEVAGVPQILIFTQDHLVSHAPADGSVLWRAPWPGGTECVSQPVVLPGDRVFLSTGYGVGGKLFGVRREPTGALAVDLVWESRGLKAKFANVVYHDGFLYGLDDGILVCLDPADGSRRWKGGRYGHGQAILVDDLLVVQAEDGSVALVEATPEEHRELGRLEALDGKTWNPPALAGRTLFVRNDREAAAFELP